MYTFFKNKRVFITGATGFIGSWLCAALAGSGAHVTGFALPPADESLFSICSISKCMEKNFIGDVRDFDPLFDAFRAAKPEIVFHLAAQPVSREGFANPAYTYEANLLGAINILECIRMTDYVQSFINVTVDVAYHNSKWTGVFSGHEASDGYGPYTVSKSCSELITQSYVRSFFRKGVPAVSTVRTGHCIGGGDFSGGRVVSDYFRALIKHKPLIVRNQNLISPYLHVLDMLNALLMIAEGQYGDKNIAGAYNIGPDEYNLITAGAFADLLCSIWGGGAVWSGRNEKQDHLSAPTEPDFPSIALTLFWQPVWSIEEAVSRTVDWYKAYINGEDVSQVLNDQLNEFASRLKWPIIKSHTS